jgi:hypothetical protein
MKYPLLSASLLVSSASALHLPFTRRIPHSKRGTMTKPNANVFAEAGSLGLQNTANNFYSAVLTVDGKGVYAFSLRQLSR